MMTLEECAHKMTLQTLVIAKAKDKLVNCIRNLDYGKQLTQGMLDDFEIANDEFSRLERLYKEINDHAKAQSGQTDLEFLGEDPDPKIGIGFPDR